MTHWTSSKLKTFTLWKILLTKIKSQVTNWEKYLESIYSCLPPKKLTQNSCPAMFACLSLLTLSCMVGSLLAGHSTIEITLGSATEPEERDAHWVGNQEHATPTMQTFERKPNLNR